MANSIDFAAKYLGILDEVYQTASVSKCLNSGPSLVQQAGKGAKEIKIPVMNVTGLGDYRPNVGYVTGAITYSFETRRFNYDRGVRLFADVMEVDEAGAINCFVAAGAELQRCHVAPEADAFTFSQIAGFEGVSTSTDDFSNASAVDVLAKLRDITSQMDEQQVTDTTRYLFITPTLRGVLDDYSFANQARSNRVLERFNRIVQVPQSRFYTAIDLLSGENDQFGYACAAGGYELTGDTEVDSSKTYYTESNGAYTAVASPTKSNLGTYYELVGKGAPINFMVVEKSAVVKFDKHTVSRIFPPDELESLDSWMLKYRKYGICTVMGEKVAGIAVSAAPAA